MTAQTQPKGWKETTLGEVAEITSSKRIFAEEYLTSGIPFYRGKEIIEKFNGSEVSTELFISEDKFNEIKKKFGAPDAGEMLLTSVGTLGIPYLVKKNEHFYFKDGNITWFKNFNGINNTFLYYWIISDLGKEQLASHTIGSTQQALTIDGLKSISILLPPLPEQHEIACVLSSLDDKRELLRKQNEMLEAIARTIFHEWFVEFNFPNEGGKPHKASGGKIVDNELGEIPDGWRVFSFPDLFIFEKGEKPQEVSDERREGFVSHILIEALDGGVQEYASRKGVVVDEGDILMVMDGASSGRVEIGYSGVIGSTISVLRLKESLPAIIYFALKHVEENIRKHTTGSAIPHTDKNYVYDFQIALPPDTSLLEQMERVLFSFISKSIRNRKQTRILAQNRDVLLPKLMSGEVRVGVK